MDTIYIELSKYLHILELFHFIKMAIIGPKKKRDEFRLGFFGSLLPGVGLVCRRKCCTEFLKKKKNQKESHQRRKVTKVSIELQTNCKGNDIPNFLLSPNFCSSDLKSQKFREYVRASVKRFQFRPMWGGWGIDCVG